MRSAFTTALVLAAVTILIATAAGASPAPALAAASAPGFSAVPAPPRRGVVRTHGVICKAVGLLSGIAGTVCKTASHPKTIVRVGKKLVSGDPGGALKSILGSSPGVVRAVAAAGALAAVVAWVTGSAHWTLQHTAKLIGASSRPNLLGTWFSSAYWRVAGVAALLTLPFLFAAAIQALLRGDMTLLGRAAFGYLPLGMLAIGVAGPMAMLLLSASDELSAIVSSASGHADGSFLAHAGVSASAVGGAALSPFVAFFVGLLTVAATLTLWLELLIREAAVYVIVLMLPLFFAALVWPARRVWAVRAVELLVALIMSKFAIVAVLALGGAALDHAASFSVTSLLAGLTLVLLAAFSPWALLRLLPLHEMASAAAGGMRAPSLQPLLESAASGSQLAGDADERRARLREIARTADNGAAPDQPPMPPRQDGVREPVSDESIEAAGQEAATAVAVSGGAAIGERSSAVPQPAEPGGGADRRHFTAPGLETLPAQFHEEGEPQRLDELDEGRPFFAPPTGDDRRNPPTLPDPDPPTLPDPDPPTLPDPDPPTLPDPGPDPGPRRRPAAGDPDDNPR